MSPAAGLRIVDLSGPAGAYGTKLLADLGAEVIKVEPPAGDPMRRMAPHLEEVQPPESSLWWAYFSAGKKSVVLDLDSGDGRSSLRDLVGTADAVVESAGPGVLDATGMGPDRLRADHPQLIWVGISPFGTSGRLRDWAGSNLVAWAMSGVLYTSGMPDRPPVIPGGQALLACHTASLNAAIGLMLAVRARRRTGRGQLVDISMQEAMVAVSPEVGAGIYLDDLVARPRQGNRRPVTRPWGLYPTADGYASVVVLQPAHWAAWTRWTNEVTGNDAILDDVFADMRTRWEASDAIDLWTEELTDGFSKQDLFEEGQRRGIPITPVNTVADLNGDPQLAAAGFFDEIEHPALGTLRMPVSPIQLDPGTERRAMRAPLLGEHTAELLGDA